MSFGALFFPRIFHGLESVAIYIHVATCAGGRALGSMYACILSGMYTTKTLIINVYTRSCSMGIHLLISLSDTSVS